MRLTAIADAYLAALTKAFPEFATSEDLPGADHGALKTTPNPVWHAGRPTRRRCSAELRAIPPQSLRDESDRVLDGVLLDVIERNVGVRVCRLELWGAASYVNGWQAALTDLARIHPVGSDALRPMALQRARAVPRHIHNEVIRLRQGPRQGYSSPKVIGREVIRQLDELLATEPEHSPFSEPIERDSDPAFRSAYVAIVRNDIDPAVRRYRDFLRDTYLPAARHALGVSANPNGRACYDALVRQFSTVSISAAEVYETGWRQIQALDEQMRPLALRLAGTDDLAKAMIVVNTSPRFAFKTEADVIAYAQSAQDRASAAMPRAFGLYTMVPVQIQPYPEFRARAGAPGQYQSPPEDGSRPPRTPAQHLGPDLQEPCQRRKHDLPRNLAGPSPATDGGAKASANTGSFGRYSTQDSARAGRCMPSGWRTKWAVFGGPRSIGLSREREIPVGPHGRRRRHPYARHEL